MKTLLMFLALASVLIVCEPAIAQSIERDIPAFPVDLLNPVVAPTVAPYTDSPDGPTIITVVPGNGSTSGNGRSPQGSRVFNNTKYLVTGAEMNASGFPATPVTSVGWKWNVPRPTAAGAPIAQSVATTGNLRVYMKDTSGTATGLIGTFIDTNGTGYTKVIDATLSITSTDTNEFTIDVPAGGPGTSPFTPGTGNGVLIIYVYQTTTPVATPLGAPTTFCNTTGTTTSLSAYFSQTVNGTGGTFSQFRPETRLGSAVPPLVDAVSVPVVYALGKIPIPYGVPQTISAPIRNVSASISGSVDVTLTVKRASDGLVRFTDTQTGVALAVNDTVIVTFAPWTPTIAEDDSIIVEATGLSGETNLLNNRATMMQTVNTNRFAYSQGTISSGGVGFAGGSGDFVAKFTSSTTAVIDSIQVNFNVGGQPYRIGIWDASGSGGTPGTNLFQTASLTSAAGVQTLAVNPPVAVNGDYYIGVKQTGTTNVSFSYQAENPIRPNSFYFTSPSGGSTWTDFSPANPFRFMIEANIAAGSPMAYAASTVAQADTDPVTPGGANQKILRIEVVTTGNLLPISATSFSLNTTGSTAPADISNAKLYFTGASSTFAAANQFGSTVASPAGAYVINGSQALGSGTNYFWLAYDVAGAATIGNVVDGECTSVTVAGNPETPTVTAPAGNREIKSPLAGGTYSVGLTLFNKASGRSLYAAKEIRSVMREVPVFSDATTLKENASVASALPPFRTELKTVEEERTVLMENGVPVTGHIALRLTERMRSELGLQGGLVAIYPTITAAFFDLNTLGVSGPVEFQLVDATYPSETYPLTINVTAANVPTSTNTVTLKPAPSVTPLISGSFAGPILRVINTNYVTIDGSNSNGGTTRDLTIANTGITTPNVIHIGSSGVTPVTNATVKNCVLTNGAQTSSAVVVSDGGTLGNPGFFSNITIRNNSIQKAFIGVYTNGGTAPQQGSNVTYVGNSVDATGVNAIRLIGLYMQGVNGGLVSGNSIGNFEGVSGEDDRGIWIASGTINATVERNAIFGLKYTGTAGFGAQGIAVSSGQTASAIVVKNNMVYDISGDGWDVDAILTDNPLGIVAFGVQTGVSVLNNSINLSGNTLNQTNALSAGIALGTGTVADVRNNIIVNNLGLLAGTGLGSAGILAQTASSQFLALDHNNYFVSPTGSGISVVGRISTSNSATLGDWQTATASEANGVYGDPLFVGATNLHIVNTASPAGQAGTSVAAVVDDFDGELRKPVPDIGADEFSLGTSVAAGWNLVSNPVTTASDSMKQLFPTSLFDYGFRFEPGSGYQQAYELLNGVGYWAKFPGAAGVSFSGTPRTSDSISVMTGWNLIGSISAAVDTGDVTTNPPGIQASAIFGYPYSPLPDAVTPGKGYWMKANAPGKVYLEASPSPAARPHASNPLEALSILTITDATGTAQTLYFGADTRNTIATGRYEMPPAPPAGIFDARFENAHGGFMVQTHTPDAEAAEFPVAIQSAAFPLTVSWNVKGTVAYELTDATGKSSSISGEGAMVIAQNGVSRLGIRLAGGSGLPAEFALLQNYPNPFNPSTNLRFALPLASKVSVEIYNVLGQRVRSLVNTVLPAGYHAVEWNGRGNSDQVLGSGVYFVKFSAAADREEPFSDVRKIMMMK